MLLDEYNKIHILISLLRVLTPVTGDLNRGDVGAFIDNNNIYIYIIF